MKVIFLILSIKMAIFELTARHSMYLGDSNKIDKGEQVTLNIHTMGVQPFNLFSNPESRRQAIQQFAINGIDVKSRDYLLNTGHWDIKRLPDNSFSKSIDLHNPFTDFKLPGLELPHTNDVTDDVEMKKGCINLVKNFYNEGLDLNYAEQGLEGRCEIALDFYEGVKGQMGIDAEMYFAQKPFYELGGYNPDTNKIVLNANYLENPNCEDLLNTILHESRHAFQNKCVQNPDLVTVKNIIIEVWKDNFIDYIQPQYDFEAYENQEIEKDANYFADSVMEKGMDAYYV